MMRALIFCILFLSGQLLTFGQVNQTVRLEGWELMSQQSVRDLRINYFSFSGAVNAPEYGALPLSATWIKRPATLFECQPEFTILAADTLSLEDLPEIADLDLVPGDFAYEVNYRELEAEIRFLPFLRLNDSKIVRVREYRLHVEYVPGEPAESEPRNVNSYADHSVLAEGTWIKLGITRSGIHQITYDDLLLAGIDPTDIDPERLGIFGNYNGMLPEGNGYERPDDLQENAIEVSGAEDGSFDAGDQILFYALGPRTWRYNIFSGRFDHANNLYTDTSYYFLTTDRGEGKRIGTIGSIPEEPTQQANSFIDHAAVDNDLENLLYSGKEWYGERFTGDTVRRTFSFTFPNLRKDRPLYLKLELATRAYIYTHFRVTANGATVIDTTRLERVTSNSSTWARDMAKSATFFSDSDQVDITIEYLSDDPNAITWLNYLVLNAERMLDFAGGQMYFMNPKVTAEGNITRFKLSNTDQNTRVWEITDVHNPSEVAPDLNGSQLEFTRATDEYLRFIAFDGSEYFQPVSMEAVQNQDLHGLSNVNYVIVSPEPFLGQAERLAKLHHDIDQLGIAIVTPEQVYNEFSSGSQDVAAIRDFMRMLRQKGAFGGDPAYLLLFGDASYDYKHRVHDNNNMVPTYQSQESLRLTGSYVTDDFFGLLDSDEGLNCTGELDVGIGRFPVTTLEQATAAVDKVEHYMQRDQSVMRRWRNTFCFVADDSDKNLHLNQANSLISVADTLHPGIHINKLFSDAYTRVDVPGGKSFPEMNKKIAQQVEQGALIINYTGHGGLIGWSAESILDVPTIRGFDNYDNLPLFITATCEFSRFDDPEFTSAGEYVFLNLHGGGIGLLTTTRLAYAHANIVVNLRIYQHMVKDEQGRMPRLGDLVRVSKIPSSNNYLNFVLLGDPALRLAYPRYDVLTTTINDRAVEEENDTIRALSHVTISGEIVDHQNEKVESFTGYIFPRVYDKPTTYTTLGTDDDSYPVDFQLDDKILYDGKVSVINGEFTFSFVVPRDIAFRYDFGKVNYYALDTLEYNDAWGTFGELFIGGIDESADADEAGPEIRLYLEDRNFNPGETTSSKPMLIADISDEHGVSFTGNSLGRDITMHLDDDLVNSHVLNDYFSYHLNSYQEGSLHYKLGDIEKGWHTLHLKAWDLQNNSSTEQVDFYVDDAAEILLSGVVNYPNPFAEYTRFGFVHNKSGGLLTVEVRIYDLNGKYIGYLKQDVNATGKDISPILWDGRDANGNIVPGGVYTYNIIVSDIYGNSTIQRQKMIKITE